MARQAKRGDPKVAIAYLRASTDKQELGLETQQDAIERWATEHGVRIAVFERDSDVSGGTPLEKRAGLQRAIAGLRAHKAGLLLVAKRDRLARDVIVAATVERAVTREGAQLFSVDGIGNGDGPADMLMRTMLDGVAQFEKAIIRKRIRDVLALKKSRGERTGGVTPYGTQLANDDEHRLVKSVRECLPTCRGCLNLEPNPDELETVRRARELSKSGLSYRQIMRALAEAGRFNRRGNIFDLKQIARFIAHGRNEHGREKIEIREPEGPVVIAASQETPGVHLGRESRDRVRDRDDVTGASNGVGIRTSRSPHKYFPGLHRSTRTTDAVRRLAVSEGLPQTPVRNDDQSDVEQMGSSLVAACGRGHVHEAGERAIGAFCTEGECALEAGKPALIRRIAWR